MIILICLVGLFCILYSFWFVYCALINPAIAIRGGFIMAGLSMVGVGAFVSILAVVFVVWCFFAPTHINPPAATVTSTLSPADEAAMDKIWGFDGTTITQRAKADMLK